MPGALQARQHAHSIGAETCQLFDISPAIAAFPSPLRRIDSETSHAICPPPRRVSAFSTLWQPSSADFVRVSAASGRRASRGRRTPRIGPRRGPHKGRVMTSRAQHDRMANAIRALAMDAVEQARSGHPGLPMGAADIATVLFGRFLKFDPADPAWPDRDRFVLSAGHGSMLIYAVLHLLGYPAVTIEEIKRFRQLGSITPGHPEHGHTPAIETTTGPLGQGLANAVGMAIAERHLAATFGDGLVNHRTYVLASDGDLMEGISHEAIALAGHLRLAKLTVLFDDNGISIDGPLALADSVDQVARFTAAGWSASRIDGHDPGAITDAIEAAQHSDRPTLIACRTTIGFGAPSKAGTEKSHGSPLGADESAGAREKLGWADAPFAIPADVRALWRQAGLRSQAGRAAWDARVAALEPDARAEFARRRRGDGAGGRDPTRIRDRAREPGAGAARARRRLGGSDRLEQHQAERHGGPLGRRLFRTLHPLRSARARHGGGHE